MTRERLDFLGHDPGSSTHHIKHGIAAFLLGIACFVRLVPIGTEAIWHRRSVIAVIGVDAGRPPSEGEVVRRLGRVVVAALLVTLIAVITLLTRAH
jgi:hypothetical protein